MIYIKNDIEYYTSKYVENSCCKMRILRMILQMQSLIFNNIKNL